MSIQEKLSNIQIELKAPKNQYNAFGKYNYRSCEDILEAVKPLCHKNKTTLILRDNIIFVDGRHYVEANAILYDWIDGQSITVQGYAREETEKKGMDGSQITGASSSYARKYALNGLFNIDDTKDSDSTNSGDSKKPSIEDNELKPKISVSKPKLEMTFDEANSHTTKNGTKFEKLSDDYLQKIIDSNAGEESKTAARVILTERAELDLPF